MHKRGQQTPNDLTFSEVFTPLQMPAVLEVERSDSASESLPEVSDREDYENGNYIQYESIRITDSSNAEISAPIQEEMLPQELTAGVILENLMTIKAKPEITLVNVDCVPEKKHNSDT